MGEVFFLFFRLPFLFLQQNFINFFFAAGGYKEIYGDGNKEKHEENPDGPSVFLAQEGGFTNLGNDNQDKGRKHAQHNAYCCNHSILGLEISLHTHDKRLEGRAYYQVGMLQELVLLQSAASVNNQAQPDGQAQKQGKQSQQPVKAGKITNKSGGGGTVR